jgi:hypothetical protein
MLLTREFIMNNRTDAKAWTRRQLEIIGVTWPPQNGWIERTVGKQISRDEAARFVQAKNQVAKSTERVRNRRKQRGLHSERPPFTGEYLGFERCFGMSHEEAVDAQAMLLLRERVAIFGADWHVNCAIRLPAEVKAAIAEHGTDVLLLMLDREML